MKQHYIYIALKKKYEAEIAEARATLEIYFNDAVGIGEHPQMLEEMDNFVEKLASANDKLANLEITFGGYENQSQNLWDEKVPNPVSLFAFLCWFFPNWWQIL